MQHEQVLVPGRLRRLPRPLLRRRWTSGLLAVLRPERVDVQRIRSAHLRPGLVSQRDYVRPVVPVWHVPDQSVPVFLFSSFDSGLIAC